MNIATIEPATINEVVIKNTFPCDMELTMRRIFKRVRADTFPTHIARIEVAPAITAQRWYLPQRH